jgi:hypothetical protein
MLTVTVIGLPVYGFAAEVSSNQGQLHAPIFDPQFR